MKTNPTTALTRRHARFTLLQQWQVRGMKLRQEVARGLRRRQFMAQEQRQRLVLTELVEILRPLAPRRPHRQ
jgi:hypothetical protein